MVFCASVHRFLQNFAMRRYRPFETAATGETALEPHLFNEAVILSRCATVAEQGREEARLAAPSPGVTPWLAAKLERSV